jgi:hypothetical protein
LDSAVTPADQGGGAAGVVAGSSARAESAVRRRSTRESRDIVLLSSILLHGRSIVAIVARNLWIAGT